MTEPVALESILQCFRGVIPSPIATCGPDGSPNVTYLSIVHYVDSERVALSRQFFNKTSDNLAANPVAQVRVVDPDSYQQYALDLRLLYTETEGPTFDAVRTNLEALASQTGMSGVFRLRGIDVHHVVRCAAVGQTAEAPPARVERDSLIQIDEFMRQVAGCEDYDQATTTILKSIHDVFEFTQSILLVHDPDSARLFAVADNGFAGSGAGAEVTVGEGVIGTAASRDRVVCVPHMARGRILLHAGRGDDEGARAFEIPLPGLEDAQSVAAVPVAARGTVRGVLYLESRKAGTFGPHNERLLRVLGRHIGAILGGFDIDSHEHDPAASAAAATETGDALRVRYYQADDSVFVDDEYVIKGVPGRILWKLLGERVAGRETFTNRELRLDERLGLPVGADNLEARLLVLRKRLAGGAFGIELDRVARGRLALRVSRPLDLREIETRGPMRGARTRPDK